MKQFKFSADDQLAVSPAGIRLTAAPATNGVSCDSCQLWSRTSGCCHYGDAAAARMNITQYCRCTAENRKDGRNIIWVEV